MPSKLLYNSPEMDRAIAFCWDTQRTMLQAKFEGWGAARERTAINMRKALWRRFPRGIRTEAHYIFMGELNEQLGKPDIERDTDKPVWFNERNLGWTHNPGESEPTKSAGESSSPIITARN